METVTGFIFLGSKITADGDCSHEFKRCLILRRKVMTNLDSMLKSRDITLPTKVHLVKAMAFPVDMYGCESWIIKKAECWRIDAFFFFFPFIVISWRPITPQHCSGFHHTQTWISHGFTCIPHLDPPSHLPLYPVPRNRTVIWPSNPTPGHTHRGNQNWKRHVYPCSLQHCL